MPTARIPQLIEGLYTTEPKLGESDEDILGMLASAPWDDNPALARLKKIGAPVVPFLIGALANPRTRSHYREARGHLDPRSPFARICDLLDDLNPPEAAASLASYLEHPVIGFRRQAALCLGSIGAPPCIAPVTEALASPHEGVRTFAMMGIERGVRDGRNNAAFLKGIFPAIASLLNEYDYMGLAPELLLLADRERALALLLAPKCLSAANPNLEMILKALNAVHYRIPHRLLLPLLKRLESRCGMARGTHQFAQALVAYSNNPDASTEGTLRSALASPDPEIATAAAKALAVLRGVDKIFQRILQIEERDGFDALSEPQKRYYAVFLYDADLRNGGHIQYLGNFAPRDFRFAVDGLRTIQAPKRSAILQKALQVFGPAGPPNSGSRRRQILMGLTERQRKFLSKLDQRYFAGEENVDKLLALYAVEHRKDFARKRIRSRSA